MRIALISTRNLEPIPMAATFAPGFFYILTLLRSVWSLAFGVISAMADIRAFALSVTTWAALATSATSSPRPTT